MKNLIFIIIVIVELVIVSCKPTATHESQQEKKDYAEMIVGTWITKGYNPPKVEIGTEHIISADGSINSHFFYGGAAFRVAPVNHYRKWIIEGDTLIIIDEKSNYKHLIKDVREDTLILQSIDTNVLCEPDTFVRKY